MNSVEKEKLPPEHMQNYSRLLSSVNVSDAELHTSGGGAFDSFEFTWHLRYVKVFIRGMLNHDTDEIRLHQLKLSTTGFALYFKKNADDGFSIIPMTLLDAMKERVKVRVKHTDLVLSDDISLGDVMAYAVSRELEEMA